MSGNPARQESRKRPRASAQSDICHFTNDTFSFRNAVVPKHFIDSDSESDDGLAPTGDGWQRNEPIDVEDDEDEEEEQECSYDDSLGVLSSDKDDSYIQIQETKKPHLRRSPTPPPDLSEQTLQRINRMNSKTRVLDSVLSSLQQAASCASVMSPVPQIRHQGVINIDDMDSPVMLPPDRTITVKVRTRLGIKRLHMKAGEPFGQMIKELAKQEGVQEENIMLSLKDQNILGQDTPLSIKLTVADIIECIIMEKPASKDDENTEDMIVIKVQGSDNASKKTFRVSKFQKLEKLLHEYSQFRNLSRKKLVFSFDGDILNGNETPEELDMEEENVIDVRTKK